MVTQVVPPPKSHGPKMLGAVVLLVGGFLAAGKAQVLPPSWNPFAASAPASSASNAGGPSSTRQTHGEPKAVEPTSASHVSVATAPEPSAEAAPGERPSAPDSAEKRQDNNDTQASHGKKPAPKGRPEKPGRHVALPEKHVAHESNQPAAPVAPVATAPAPISPPAPAEEKPVETRPAREEPMKEAERLLSQGEVEQACRKGEEVRRSTPRAAAIYKFLGKCYMRAGKAGVAQENYKHYLELAPDAPDAAFIRSYVK